MTNSNDRLDRIETLLEQFITASVADRQASNERMTRLEQSMAAMDEKTNTRFNQLVAEADANREITFGMLDQMLTLQEETKQILDYLFGQQKGNGHGLPPQP